MIQISRLNIGLRFMAHDRDLESGPSKRDDSLGLIAMILIVATLLRIVHLGRLSYWYDEVVTVRLARTANPAALFALLGQIDATRAWLHPLLLQEWVKVLGPSERATRGFSVICGLLTVGLIGRLGRRLFDDDATGLWASALAAISPLLVLYSREARMYAWLVLMTCMAWNSLLSLGDSRKSRARRVGVHGLALAAVVASHPLGLLMAAALGLASVVNRRGLGISWGDWFCGHLFAALLVLPWVGHYFDHDPESTVGRLSIRFLLGTPIGFLGGNFLTLAGFLLLIGHGLISIRRREDGRVSGAVERPVSASMLLIWLTVPPAMLYGYSWLSHPVFGPARYALFVAPAYLILVGHGIARLPRSTQPLAGLFAVVLAAASIRGLVFAPDLKADWRGAAIVLDREDRTSRMPLVVVSTDPEHNVEVETARYYLGTHRLILPAPAPLGLKSYWLAIGLRDGRPVSEVPDEESTRVEPIDLPGLRLTRIER